MLYGCTGGIMLPILKGGTDLVSIRYYPERIRHFRYQCHSIFNVTCCGSTPEIALRKMISRLFEICLAPHVSLCRDALKDALALYKEYG